MAYSNFLGYDRGPNGGFVVNQEEAKTVRQIYKWYMEGYSLNVIAKRLTELGIPKPMKKKIWGQDTVGSILRNEKYKGDALLQKYYTTDFLTKKMKKNEGEVPQYYVEGDHEAIIDPVTFDLVQAEYKRRSKIPKYRYSGKTIFSSKIICGECGNWYGPKVWHSNSKYRKVVYRCNHKYGGDKKCSTPHLTEAKIRELFVKAMNKIITEKEELLGNAKVMMETVCGTHKQEKEAENLAKEMEILAEMIQETVGENARVAKDQNEYQSRYTELSERYEEKMARYDQLQDEITEKKIQAKQFENFIIKLGTLDEVCTEFDGGLWASLLESVTVYAKDDIRFTFRGGMTIKV